jgi:hypothetical protein
MATSCCPNCGHHLQAASRKQATIILPEREVIDRAYNARAYGKDAYFAQCKAIGYRDDLRFLIRVAGASMPANLAIEASELLSQLETRASKAIDGKAINSIRDRYRMSKGSLKVYSAEGRAA